MTAAAVTNRGGFLKGRWLPLVRALTALFVSAAWLPSAGGVETIQSQITCNSREIGGESLRISCTFHSLGSATIYAPAIYLFLGEHVDIIEDNANVPAGERLAFERDVAVSSWPPGDYTVAVAAFYEERSGRRHQAYHLFPVTVGALAQGASGDGLRAAAGPVDYNPKVFWGRSRSIALTVSHMHDAPVSLRVTPYLMDGYRSTRGSYDVTLVPGQEERLTIPLSFTAPVESRYFLDIQYLFGGRHFSRILSGNIVPRTGPVYFAIYLFFSGGVLGFFLLVCAFRRRRPAAAAAVNFPGKP